jgi:predicted secreted hydrolase
LNKLIYIFPLLFFFISCSREEDTNVSNEISVSSALSSVNDSGFLKAYDVRKFNFPEDHGPHYGYRTEWWYFTGNLGSEGRKFGYQLTFFRTALNPDTPAASSGWSSNQIYMGHFTLSDISDNRFYYFERFSREGNDLAGAGSSPFRVWIENWNVTEVSGSSFEFPVIKLTAANENISIELKLEPVKKIVLQGDNGYSKKGAEPGNASYYYSIPGLKTNGVITIGDNAYNVEGSSWLDREWSTSALSQDQQGWDWFSLHLDNNYDIMYYQMRKKDGSPDEFTSGAIIDPEGNKKTISISDVDFQVTDKWENSNGKIYPSGWTLKIPYENTELKIIPALKDQELLLTVRYWEGAVEVNGFYNNLPLNGHGYAELTGYDK